MSSLNNSRLDTSSKKDKIKKDESRVLYLKNNRSNIFQTSTAPSKNTHTAAVRNNSEFKPKYYEESAVSRKMKEFHNVNDRSINKSNNFGRLKQEVLM
jgi:hypothetical protein